MDQWHTWRVAEGIYRISLTDPSPGSALNRYGFIVEDQQIPVTADDTDELAALLKTLSTETHPKGTSVTIQAAENEDWIGFGDVTRERMFHRGEQIDCWVKNVKSYVPVPFFISTLGYAILVNSTHRVTFDMAASQPDTVQWIDYSGQTDFYVLLGGSLNGNIRLYTQLTGRPSLPPEWSFGLWYICREQANDFEMVSDATHFREKGIPCDVIGLEPGWTEKKYDLSPDKKWHPERFPIPKWCPNGPHNFIDAVRRMGYHVELWECNEYDLSFEEERRLGSRVQSETSEAGNFQKGAEEDEHFSWPRFADTLTRRGEPWFEHHKKFIDQGVDFFKQDGTYQVCEHPDRVWGNGMLDTEMHNLYPLLYARQMADGIREHTGKRPITFTVSGWTGFQAFAGTWAGDTGGRVETLGGMLNTSVMGHNWQTNDMEVMQPAGIHFGYLLPWSQINSWTYFRMPWVQGQDLMEMHTYYSQLRSRLIPYLYTWAYETSQQGMPLLLRPLQLEFEDDAACREVMHEYLLGRDLLVTIYNKTVYLPAGRWKDYWTGEVFDGNQTISTTWPESRGGGLFVREGAIVPLGPVMQFRKEKPLDEIELYLFPGPGTTSFDLYEDDGVTEAYQHGEYSTTRVTMQCTPECIKGTIADVHRGCDVPAQRLWTLRVALDAEPGSIELNEKTLNEWTWDSTRREVTCQLPAGEFSFRIHTTT